MRRNSNRRLYESIMKDIAKTVKRHLNEYEYTVDLDNEDVSNTYNINQKYDEEINIIFDNSGSMYTYYNYMWQILHYRLKAWKQNKKDILFNFYYLSNLSKPIQIDLLERDSLEKLEDIKYKMDKGETGGSDIYDVIKEMGRTNTTTWILTDIEAIYSIPFNKIHPVFLKNIEFWVFYDNSAPDNFQRIFKKYNLNFVEYFMR